MNKFLVLIFTIIVAISFNEPTYAARKKTSKKAKATSSKEYKAKNKASKVKKTKVSKKK